MQLQMELRNGGSGYWRIGDTSSTSKKYINLSTTGGIGSVKTFEYSPDGNAALVVNENNEIYICMIGANPVKINDFTYDQVKEIYTKIRIHDSIYFRFYIELNDGTKKSIFGDIYDGEVGVDNATPPEDEPDPTPTPEVKSGLVVEDGKLYLYTNNGTTIIKDSKYKLN